MVPHRTGRGTLAKSSQHRRSLPSRGTGAYHDVMILSYTISPRLSRNSSFCRCAALTAIYDKLNERGAAAPRWGNRTVSTLNGGTTTFTTDPASNRLT